MRHLARSVLALTALSFLYAPAASAQGRGRATYVKRYNDPVLEAIRKLNKNKRKAASKATAAVHDRYKAKKERKRKTKRKLLDALKGVAIPASPKVFKKVFHFKPVAQYYTGTCWSFSSTSFVETEVFRLTGKKIKLSEMHTVYYEYLEKARRWIRHRGHSAFSEGSESNAIFRVFRRYGAMPLAAYSGLPGKDKRHNHVALAKAIKAYLGHLKTSGVWDEKLALASIRLILNRHLGAPPKTFSYGGATYTARRFLKDVMKLDPTAYVELMSTSKQRFYRYGLFDVPDNWWRSRDYFNVPLKDFYAVVAGAVGKGYTAVIGGDVSEPGKIGFKDAAIIPDYDLPQSHINQHSREYRIASVLTTDDHGIHLVGKVRHGGRDWYLIKDSGRSARHGKAKGYYYFRDDFIKLKMLTLTVHRDALPKALRAKLSRAKKR